MRLKDATYLEVLFELAKRDLTLADIARSLETSRQHVAWNLRRFMHRDEPPRSPMGREILLSVERALMQPLVSNDRTTAPAPKEPRAVCNPDQC
jgi:hypothetical protein